MSTTPDDDPLPVADPATPVEPEAKPARRRRAAASAAPPAEASVEPAASPVRRRRVVEAAAAAGPAAPGVDSSPGAARAAEPVMPAAVAELPPPAPVAAAAADEAPTGAARLSDDGDAEPGEAPGDGGDVEGRGPRGRRRNRRRRGERSEAEGAEARPQVETAAPSGPPPDVAGLFAEVLSGAFDVEVEPEASVEAEAPAKRVLAAEPEAPKLHKVLAQAGIGSRRDMEEMILEGRISVNGQPAHIGQRISFGDQIKIDGKPVKVRIVPPPPRIVAYHKPAGEIVTHDDPQNRPTVFRRLPRLSQGKWQSVGRLDINTEGLLLFTNSGELANQLMHPRFGVEREYAVRVLGTLDEDAREQLLEGVEIDGQTAAFKSIEEGGGDGANRWYRVVITEGRNREVRRLFDAVGLTVNRLIRIRYGTVVLPRGLKRGMWVDLGEDDVRAIRRLAAPQQRDDRGGRGNNASNKRNKQRGGRGPDRPREPRPMDAPPTQAQRPAEPGFEGEDDLDDHHGPIPNPLEQTFDKRFVQNPRTPAGGRGFGRGGGGFGPGGSVQTPAGPKKGKGPREPDPMQTSVGYIGADAFHRKRGGGGGRGGGGYGGGGRGFGGGR